MYKNKSMINIKIGLLKNSYQQSSRIGSHRQYGCQYLHKDVLPASLFWKNQYKAIYLVSPENDKLLILVLLEIYLFFPNLFNCHIP